MLKRKYRWKGLNVLEIHYLDNVSEYLKKINLKNIDIIKLYQVKENYKNKLDKFYTLHINLEDSEDDIFKKFHSNSRNEIRKNIKDDNVTFHFKEQLSEAEINNFIKELDIFMGKKEHSIDSIFQLQQVKDFNKNVILTEVKRDGIALALHLYFFDGNRARYKLGVSYRMDKSIDSKVVGRANRGLHWFDIKLFKNKGLILYDLGGISHNTKDKAKININKFKEKFTKNKAIEYQGNIGISLKGKLALFFHKILQKTKKCIYFKFQGKRCFIKHQSINNQLVDASAYVVHPRI